MTPLKWIERYDIPSDRKRHEGWAIIHIDSNGFLGVVSDYGNYAFHWSSFEGDFKAFLGEVSSDYLYSKLSSSRVIYDGYATERAIKAHILSQRRTKAWTANDARTEWDLLAEHEVDHDTSDGFSCWYRDTSIRDAHEFYQTRPEPQCVGFCEKIWPTFIERLKAGRHTPLDLKVPVAPETP
jgi:hypothetical protein